MKKYLLSSILILIIFNLTASAHKVNIFAYSENGMVYTESYFNDGKKVQNGTVKVYDNETNKLLITGKTNKSGEFTFKIPEQTDLKIVIEAGLGHRNVYVLKDEEVTRPDIETSNTGPINQNQEKLIERIVDKKTEPIMKRLSNIEKQIQKPGLSEILGGLGYIIGLMGIAAYFKSKKRNDK